MEPDAETGTVPGPWADIASAVADADRFVSASFTGARRGLAPASERVQVRPVDLRDGRHLQVTRFDGRSTAVDNLSPDGAEQLVLDLLRAGHATVFVRTLDGDLQLQHSRRGAPRIVRHRPSADRIDTAHDRSKPRLITPDAPFLHAVGITDRHGRVKPTAAAKYRQVERFVEILDHAWAAADVGDGPVRAVDLGCGAGVLTLAAHHHLSRLAPGSTMVGVDTKTALVDGLRRTVTELALDGISFVDGEIADFEPAQPPDVVIALHACDTATDDALARAVRWSARLVLVAPCCQHHLQAQLDRHHVPDGLEPLLRHGIVRERLGDLLTDTLRAEILRANGYRTDVIEFVSTDHTAKNLMIRAVRSGADATVRDDAQRAADALAAAWGVTPALLERLAAG